MKIFFQLLTLVIFMSCSTSRLEYNMMDELTACYEPEFKQQLDIILSELDKHIARNGYNTFSNYLHALKKGKLDLDEYVESEKILGAQLIEKEFKKLFCDYSYVEGGRNGKVLTYEDYLANPRHVAIKKDLSREKTFLKCLNTIGDKSGFVSEFLQLDMTTTSPNEFTRWIFEYQNKPGYNEDIAKQIIALEMYVLVLEVIGDKTLCSNTDCP